MMKQEMQGSDFCEGDVGGYFWREGEGNDWNRAPAPASGAAGEVLLLDLSGSHMGVHLSYPSLSYPSVLYDFLHLCFILQ